MRTTRAVWVAAIVVVALLGGGLGAAGAGRGEGDARTFRVASGGSLSVTVGGTELRVRAAGRTARFRGPARLVAHSSRRALHLSANGRPLLQAPGASFSVRALRGRLRPREELTGSLARPSVRLAHRLSLIQFLTPRRAHYFGSGQDGRLRFQGGWTIGFVPGALWRTAALLRDGRLARWASSATLRTAGHERDDDHDRGFVYGRGAGTGLRLACTRGAPFNAGAGRCSAFKRMVLAAAAQLHSMAERSPAGVIPTSYSRCSRCRPGELDVIVDSLPNLALLTQAAGLTGRGEYRATALRHALWVVENLVRPDGSTFQSAHISRETGELLRRETHQGLRASSTWSRGQAWAIHGFAALARDLGDPRLLDAARKVADHWMSRLAARVPRYDLDAPAGAPVDSTAATIAAAGFAILAKVCEQSGSCDPVPYRAYGGDLTRAVSELVSRSDPLGKLGGGAYVVGRGPRWDDRAELAFGLDFLAEALGG